MTDPNPELPDIDRITAASFAGTLAFGRLAITLLFAANAVGYLAAANGWHAIGMLAAVASAGSAYVAQSQFTSDEVNIGMPFMYGSIIAAVFAAFAFLMGA